MPKVIRDQVGVKALNGYGEFRYRVFNADAVPHNITVETALAVLQTVICVDGTAGVLIVGSQALSSVHPQTIKVTFAIPAVTIAYIIISGTNGNFNDTLSFTADTTFDEQDIF